MRRVENPPNPWLSHHVEWFGEPPEVPTRVWEQSARSILSENTSPDVPFRWSVNPYRGCHHACAYCYARPSHQYLDFGAGSDFETQLVVKTNAAELLRSSMLRPRWTGDMIAFSGNTDCYQPLEASYRLTRRCLEVCLEFHNPVGIVTKGALIRRDIDLLERLARDAFVFVWVSIAFADDAPARALEPGAASVGQRLKTIRALREAGIGVGVAVAPIIPGLSDAHVPRVLEAAAEAGATRAFSINLRLPAEVEQVFEERLRRAFPHAADKVMSSIESVRGGRRNDPRFGSRMVGVGPRWEVIASMFQTQCRRLGLETEPLGLPGGSTFRRPQAQQTLF